MEKISILLADDHQLILECWKFMLNADERFNVIGIANNGKQVVGLVKVLKPKVVLMDINMKEADGFEATKEIRKVSPGTKIIGVSMHTMPAYAKKMLRTGASGYVTKSSPSHELIKAIVEVVKGNIYLCEEVKDIMIENEINHDARPDINMLSNRELEIARLVSSGLSSKEISGQLHLSLKTIEVHRYNILKKLDLPNAVSLVNFINCNGI